MSTSPATAPMTLPYSVRWHLRGLAFDPADIAARAQRWARAQAGVSGPDATAPVTAIR